MILDVTRGYVRVVIDERTANVPGEMLFPEKLNLGFVVFLDQVRYWDPPHQHVEITYD